MAERTIQESANAALAHLSNALDDLESSPDQRPIPLVREAMEYLREIQLAAEGAGGGVNEALRAAAASLRTIASHAGRMECLESLDEVRAYANSRATVAEAALRADGEEC